VLGKPVVQLYAGTVGHAKIRDDDLIAADPDAPDFSERHSAIFRFIRIPATASQVAHQRRAYGRLVIHHQRSASGVGSIG
jgi:hypothetical protein